MFMGNSLINDFIQEMFKDESFMYLILASVISADNVLTKKDAEDGLVFYSEFENAVKQSDKTEEEKNKLLEYVENGKEILNQSIENFKTIGK